MNLWLGEDQRKSAQLYHRTPAGENLETGIIPSLPCVWTRAWIWWNFDTGMCCVAQPPHRMMAKFPGRVGEREGYKCCQVFLPFMATSQKSDSVASCILWVWRLTHISGESALKYVFGWEKYQHLSRHTLKYECLLLLKTNKKTPTTTLFYMQNTSIPSQISFTMTLASESFKDSLNITCQF